MSGEGLLVVETNPNIFKRRCAITESEIMDILPGSLLHVHRKNVSTSRLTTKTCHSRISDFRPTCIVHTRSDEPDPRGEAQIANEEQVDIRDVDTNIMIPPTKMGCFRPLQSRNINSVVNIVVYKPPERRGIKGKSINNLLNKTK